MHQQADPDRCVVVMAIDVDVCANDLGEDFGA